MDILIELRNRLMHLENMKTSTHPYNQGKIDCLKEIIEMLEKKMEGE